MDSGYEQYILFYGGEIIGFSPHPQSLRRFRVQSPYAVVLSIIFAYPMYVFDCNHTTIVALLHENGAGSSIYCRDIVIHSFWARNNNFRCEFT